MTWTSFSDEQAFNEWYDSKMQSWYQIIEKGVSDERAVELCLTLEVNLAVKVSKLREIGNLTRRINKELSELTAMDA